MTSAQGTGENRALLPPMPGFDDFYAAVNGSKSPFPWQRRLATQVQTCGYWPSEIGIPTGLGKTACLDIAVWWLASEADVGPRERSAPTRIWWVVNRRLLVDSTHRHAQHIAERLEDPSAAADKTHEAVLCDVAARLRHLTGAASAVPLQIVQLRGGVAASRPRDPSQPAVILSTVPMFGSRLLFRGYGSSRSMRPIDAAHAGTDSLVLVDEAHLATHLMRLVPALNECMPSAVPVLPARRSAPQLVSLTATGDSSVERFQLDDADVTDDTVRQRLGAHKRLKVRTEDKGDCAKHLAEAAAELLDSAAGPSSCVVFANTPANARAVFAAFKADADVLLLTGLNREPDAQNIRNRILDPVHGVSSERENLRRERHLVVIATQTLEVGADVDFEFLVTEQCGVRALIQRLGRLNRLGRFPHSQATYVHMPAPKRAGQDAPGWPVYGEEPTTVLEQLEQVQGFADDIDVSPQCVASVLGAPMDDPGRAPEILPALLWEWVKTTTPPPGEAPVEPYFSGIADPGLSVSVIWRCHVPQQGQRLWPRPRQAEALEIRLPRLRGRNDAALVDDEELARIGIDGVTIEWIKGPQIRPGDTLVLRADRGLLDEFGWSPESKNVVVDLSIQNSGLPLDHEALRLYCGASVASLIAQVLQDDAEEPENDERAVAAANLVEELRNHAPVRLEEHEWQGFLNLLDTQPVDAEGEVSRLEFSSERDQAPLYDELDEASLAPDAVELDRHGAAVGSRARRIAEAMGIDPEVADIASRAGDLHDVGKADERFQRWLADGEPGDVPLAKSKTSRSRWSVARRASGWPRGGRHEELSARLVRDWLCSDDVAAVGYDADLMLHLVVSHHGKGRPFVLPIVDGTAATVTCDIDGTAVSAAADLSLADWEQPERFVRLNERFGPWGVALLEAVVRQADHAVSAGSAEGPRKGWELH